MEKSNKKNFNKWIRLGIAFVLVLLFQFVYTKSCHYIFILISKIIKGLTNDEYLMIHHLIMFIIAFIPTFIISYKKKMNFGYHKGTLKPFLICLGILSTYEIIITIIQVLFGLSSEFRLDTIIFQLLFSGLGEEILYRSIPIAIFIYAFKGETSIKIKEKFDLDFGVLLSAVLFAIAHININFSPFSVSAYWLQLLNCFITGIVIRCCYKKSNSIWQCMILHGAVNLIIVIIPMIAYYL